MMARSPAHDWDAQAAEEAAGFSLTPAGEKHIVGVLSQVHAELPDGQLREHRVRIVPDAWQPHTTELPAHVVERRGITRGDVLHLAAGADAPDSLWRLWLATFVWGAGDAGYMPRRLGPYSLVHRPSS